MANVQLNGDVYAHLLSFVSSPSDLLAVSLANKELLTLAEPEIIYRSIRCKLGNDAVWEHLIANPAQASRVRELEVLRENLSGYGPLDEEEKIPESSGTFKPSSKPADEDALATTSREKTEHSERLLIQAIQSLVNLESFTWDHWVPEINQGEEVLRDAGEGDDDEPLETYSEDVWTALRDHTQLKRLKVVDLGRKETRSPDPRPIFDSTIFTLGNLTHFDLKMYYSPADPLEGENGGNDEDSDDELLPPRVKIERIQELLSRCPNLESLALNIIDRDFYYLVGGNPFTSISPIISQLHLPRLTSLKLNDVTVDDNIMVTFLNTHPALGTLSAFLSLLEDDLPELPFSLETYNLLSDQVLPNIELLDLRPRDLRPLLRAVKRPSPLHSLGTLEPRDWNAPEELENDENYVSSLDDVWGPSDEEAAEGGPTRGRDLQNLLTDLPNLRILTVRGVTTVTQLDKLVRLTPQLESITFHGRSIDLNPSSQPHTQLLPYLSRWPRLASLKGNHIWPKGCDIQSEEIGLVLRDIVAACPLLRETTWVDGRSATIVRNDKGEPRLELPVSDETNP